MEVLGLSKQAAEQAARPRPERFRLGRLSQAFVLPADAVR